MRNKSSESTFVNSTVKLARWLLMNLKDSGSMIEMDVGTLLKIREHFESFGHHWLAEDDEELHLFDIPELILGLKAQCLCGIDLFEFFLFSKGFAGKNGRVEGVSIEPLIAMGVRRFGKAFGADLHQIIEGNQAVVIGSLPTGSGNSIVRVELTNFTGDPKSKRLYRKLFCK